MPLMRLRDDDKPLLVTGVMLVLIAVCSLIALWRCSQ